MSSTSRSIEEIHREYSQMCSQAGHVQYQISVLHEDLDRLNEKLKELNLEAVAANAAKSAAEGA